MIIRILTAVAPYLLLFAAVVLVSAVWIGRRRPPPADPFFHPFGDVPVFHVRGFTPEQISRIARHPVPPHFDPQRRSFATRQLSDCFSGGPAIPPDAGGGGFLSSPRPAVARASLLSLFSTIGGDRHA